MKTLVTSTLAFLRFLYQSIYLALGQVWANKMRSFLTMLGIIIAVASVTAVIAALSGLKAKILSQVKTFGTNSIFMWPTRPTTGPMQNASWWDIRFRPEQFDKLLTHCPSVSRIGRETGLGQYTISLRDKSVERVQVTGVEPPVHLIEGRTVSLGRLVSEMDELQARQVCLIDAKLRDKLLLDKDCIGQSILVGYHQFIIVGLLDPRPHSLFGGGENENIEVFIPFQTSFKLNRDPWISAIAESRSADTSEDALAELRFFFRRTRHISPGQPDTFEVQSLENALKTFNKIALVVTAVAGGIVGVSLLVGGVGIMNIMLVSVSERTREIGLRKAVGARRTAILTQFLIEAVVLCFLGGLLGIGIGQLLTSGIANIPKAELDMAYVPWQAVAVAFAFSGTVGIFFGMFPAIKAARLDPIEALRHE
jgi:putative ABC transport system permease protein